MTEHPLYRILNPRSIAVVGASNNFLKMGTIQCLNIVKSGFPGEVLPVHPTEDSVLGRKAYPRILDLPYAPDLAVLVVPTHLVPGMLDDFGKLGVRRAVVISAGFKEVGEEGRDLERRIVEIAARHEIRFVGPNCIGIINTHLPLNTTFFPHTDAPGYLGMASQSGTYVTQVLYYLKNHGIRFSQAVSVGNEANIDVVDVLEYLGGDETTRAIALYLEGIRRGAEFVEVARRVSRVKPIVALYVGGTEAGARSGTSHTGALAGPNDLYDGIFRQAGVIRAQTVQDLYEWGWALATQPPPPGRRVAILTHSGGPATSMADACERMGLEVPVLSTGLQARVREHLPSTGSARNPVDLTFMMEYQTFSVRLPKILLESDEVDGLLMHGLVDTGFVAPLYELLKDFIPLTLEQFLGAKQADVSGLPDLVRRLRKPIVTSAFYDANDHVTSELQKSGIPALRHPERAVMALAALAAYSRIRSRPVPVPPPDPLPAGGEARSVVAEVIREARAGGVSVLDEYRSKKILAAYGVPVVREALAIELEDALAAAGAIGYPVVLKGCAPGIAHKSEAGLVELDIRSRDDLVAAHRRIQERAPGGSMPVLVQERVGRGGGRELVAGLARFPGFGPCVMFGLGGIYTEVLRDVTFRVAPLAPQDALEMLGEIRSARLLGAFRGMEPVDRAALASILVGLGRLAIENPEVDQADVNPLVVAGGRPVAVDALIVLGVAKEEG